MASFFTHNSIIFGNVLVFMTHQTVLEFWCLLDPFVIHQLQKVGVLLKTVTTS